MATRCGGRVITFGAAAFGAPDFARAGFTLAAVRPTGLRADLPGASPADLPAAALPRAARAALACLGRLRRFELVRAAGFALARAFFFAFAIGGLPLFKSRGTLVACHDNNNNQCR